MWNQLLCLHNLVHKCFKIVLIVLIVNGVVRSVKIKLVIMSTPQQSSFASSNEQDCKPK